MDFTIVKIMNDLAAINCVLDEVKKTYVYVIFE